MNRFHAPGHSRRRILSIAFLVFATAPAALPADVTAPLAANTPPPLAATTASGLRPRHLWTLAYLDLLESDTAMVLTAPIRWDRQDWLGAGIAAASIGATASLDQVIKDRVQAHRTANQDRFFGKYQNFGSTLSFAVIGAFECWGEIAGDTTAKNTAMDALTASIIGPGLIGTSVKFAVGRVRPPSARRPFAFKPVSGNQSFPSGHTAQAFAVATAIAENYPAEWVQILCYGGAGLVGYARIEQNGHYASDVVGGALLGWSVARAVVHRHNGPAAAPKLSWSPYADPGGGGVMVFRSF